MTITKPTEKHAVQKGTFKILFVDGTEQVVLRKPNMRELQTIICAPMALDTVNLRNGCVMVVDDTGMIDNKPVNPKATELYWSVCRPGTIHQIHGAVVLVRDSDFA